MLNIICPTFIVVVSDKDEIFVFRLKINHAEEEQATCV
jgi:predicted Fe-Mo cluster-binding NifX family protein